jgi:hypothetical protein
MRSLKLFYINEIGNAVTVFGIITPVKFHENPFTGLRVGTHKQADGQSCLNMCSVGMRTRLNNE